MVVLAEALVVENADAFQKASEELAEKEEASWEHFHAAQLLRLPTHSLCVWAMRNMTKRMHDEPDVSDLVNSVV